MFIHTLAFFTAVVSGRGFTFAPGKMEGRMRGGLKERKGRIGREGIGGQLKERTYREGGEGEVQRSGRL